MRCVFHKVSISGLEQKKFETVHKIAMSIKQHKYELLEEQAY